MNDYLILGCGYLGRRVAARCLDNGHAPGPRVFATTRKADKETELRSLGLTPIRCDVLDRASLRGLPPVAALVHAVSLDRAVTLEGLANVVDAVRAWPGAPRFVHVSSTSVYGQADGSEVDESSATEPREESGRVALEGERFLRKQL